MLTTVPCQLETVVDTTTLLPVVAVQAGTVSGTTAQAAATRHSRPGGLQFYAERCWGAPTLVFNTSTESPTEMMPFCAAMRYHPGSEAQARQKREFFENILVDSKSTCSPKKTRLRHARSAVQPSRSPFR